MSATAPRFDPRPSNGVASLVDAASEIVETGRLPRRPSGEVDLHRIERIMRLPIGTAARVGVIKRLLQAREDRRHEEGDWQ